MRLFRKEKKWLDNEDTFSPFISKNPDPVIPLDYSHLTDTVSLAENDLIKSMTASTAASVEMREGVQKVFDAALAIGKEIQGFSELSDGAKKSVYELVEGVSVVSKAAGSIHKQVELSLRIIAQAEAQSKDAIDRMKELQISVSNITEITETIAAIARKINLLSLNATIEAARAGAAGRGFAVVASEVKQLSVATEASTRTISHQIESVKKSADTGSKQVGIIASSVFDLTHAIQKIAQGSEDQSTAVMAAEQSASLASTFANDMNKKITHINTLEKSLVNNVATLDAFNVKSAAKSLSVNDHATILMRMCSQDPKRWQRWPMRCKSIIVDGNNSFDVYTADISLHGASIVSDKNLVQTVGRDIILKIPGLGSIPALVTFVRNHGIDLEFRHLQHETLLALENLLQKAEIKSEPHILKVQQFAKRVSSAFEAAITQKSIDMETLFDTDYKLVTGSNPEQFENKATSFLKTVLAPLSEDEYLTKPLIHTMVAHDRNGYVAAREACNSKPQRPDDIPWNITNARDRRFFKDYAGLLGVRMMNSILCQGYPRQMGNGYEIVAELNAPIFVFGRHWGGARMVMPFDGDSL